MNWRGKPLISYQVLVSLIAATTTATGLRVNAKPDTNRYPAGVKVRDADLHSVHYTPARFHADLELYDFSNMTTSLSGSLIV